MQYAASMSNYRLTRQDPPPMGKYGVYGNAGGRPSQWATALDPLRSLPGVWHRVEGFHATATASYLARGLASGVEPGDFEATTRREVDGEHAPKGKAFLFVRFVGGEEYPGVGVDSGEDDRAVYQGLPYVEGWAVKPGPPHNGLVFYIKHPVKGGSFHNWENAWERCDLPCPGPAPAVEDLPPGDER